MKLVLFLITISFCYGQTIINRDSISIDITYPIYKEYQAPHGFYPGGRSNIKMSDILIPEILKLWNEYKEQNYEVKRNHGWKEIQTDSGLAVVRDTSYVKRKKYNSIDGFMEYLKKRVK